MENVYNKKNKLKSIYLLYKFLIHMEVQNLTPVLKNKSAHRNESDIRFFYRSFPLVFILQKWSLFYTIFLSVRC